MVTRNRALREALRDRRKGMDAEWTHWEAHMRELRDAIQPSRGRFNIGDEQNVSAQNKRIIDSTATIALRTLRSGLMAGMTSPSRPWFRLGLPATDRADQPSDVKEWLHEAEKRLYAVFAASNVYRMFDTCYGDLGLFGTFTGLIVPDFESVLHTYSLPMGSYRLGEDGRGNITSMHRQIAMPVAGVVDMFGVDNVSKRVRDAYEANRHHERITVCHAIEKRRDIDPRSPLAKDAPWGSYYWEKDEDDTFLLISGHRVNPILAPRWEAVDGAAWSQSSPGMMAYGDALQLQVQQRDKALAIQKMHNPPMLATAQAAGVNALYRSMPGGVTAVTAADLRSGGMRPAHEVRADISALVMDIQETQRRVDQAFFRDLFLMASTGLADRSQITAREIAERHEEKLLALGPVLESMDHSLLTPVIEAAFAYLQDAHLLPPAPDGLEGQQIKVEYISLLAQAQKAIGVGAIERTIGFAGTLAQIKPEVLDLLDAETAVREFADNIGPPPAILFTEREMQERRAAREQAEQQAAMVQAAQPLAGAAKLLADANAMGAEALQRGAPL